MERNRSVARIISNGIIFSAGKAQRDHKKRFSRQGVKIVHVKKYYFIFLGCIEIVKDLILSYGPKN